MGILIPLLLVFFSCLIIWRACDGFEVASEYIGRNLSEGVRGATINAISSSLPELFTTLIALFVLADRDGFAVGIGTTAGSALFNGMIIPAACILFVVGRTIMGRAVTEVTVSSKVILRDGIALILANILLLVILTGAKLDWWQGVLLMIFYLGYVWYMMGSMKTFARAEGGNEEEDEEEEEEDDDDSHAPDGPVKRFFYFVSLGGLLDLERQFVREHHREQMKDETWNGWPLLLASAFVISLACWLLVKACEWLGTGPGNLMHPSYSLFGNEFTGIGMPTMFVAVIFASMATSVPDTVISVRDARDGDYDDAVANALGSNIFDICFALGFPLFLFTILNGPISMTQETIDQSAELRFALLVLTVVGFFIYLIGRRSKDANGMTLVGLKRGNAYVLLGIYVAFLVYIVARSYNAAWAESVAVWIRGVMEMLPAMN